MPHKESIPASRKFVIALHPGEVLRDLYLEPLGLSTTDAATVLEMPQQHLTEVLDGHRAVTPDLALRLEAAFGASARSWLNMQVNYDLVQERLKGEVMGVRRLNLPDKP